MNNFPQLCQLPFADSSQNKQLLLVTGQVNVSKLVFMTLLRTKDLKSGYKKDSTAKRNITAANQQQESFKSNILYYKNKPV